MWAGKPPTDQKIFEEFDKYDVNGDQLVDRAEFAELVKGIIEDLIYRERYKIQKQMVNRRLPFQSILTPSSYYYLNGKLGIIELEGLD